MSDEILKRDQNFITVIAGITNDSDMDITMLRVDPISKRLLVNASISGGYVSSLNGLTGAVTLAPGTNITFGTIGNTITINGSAGGVTSVSGTTNRITSTGGTTPVLDISGSYVGQSSITTLGTIGTGVWNGTTLAIANGGSGQTTANAAFNAFAPSQTGNSGKFLTTDGTNTSWATSSGGITGSGSSGQVTFWSGASSVSGDNNLFWDNTNKILGIGTNTPSATLHVNGTTSSSATNVLTIQGGIGNVGTTGGQGVAITSGAGKTWIPSSQTVGRGGNITNTIGAGGDLNDNTISGTQSAGGGGGYNIFTGGGGNLTDTPNSAAVTLTAGLGGGFSMQSGAGGDASLGDLTNTTGGAGGGYQFIAQGGGAAQSQSIGKGGNGGAMTFSLFSGGNVVAGSGATNATGGNTGNYAVIIGNAGSVTRQGTQNASAVSKGGNSGAYSITFGAGGSSTILSSAGTSTGGNAGNGTWTGANGGNASGGATKNGGNGTAYSFITGKGGTGSTANGIDGDTTFKDGYGNTVLTVKGNNTLNTVFGGTAQLKGYTVATLPAGTQGMTAFVTDALAPSFLSIIVGGGTVVSPVFYNGSNWVGY